MYESIESLEFEWGKGSYRGLEVGLEGGCLAAVVSLLSLLGEFDERLICEGSLDRRC